MNIHEMYSELFAGKTLKLSFKTFAEASTLRSRLHRYKKEQESVLLAAEFMTEEEVTKFSFQFMPKKETDLLFTAKLKFKDKKLLKNYEVVIEDQEP